MRCSISCPMATRSAGARDLHASFFGSGRSSPTRDSAFVSWILVVAACQASRSKAAVASYHLIPFSSIDYDDFIPLSAQSAVSLSSRLNISRFLVRPPCVGLPLDHSQPSTFPFRVISTSPLTWPSPLQALPTPAHDHFFPRRCEFEVRNRLSQHTSRKPDKSLPFVCSRCTSPLSLPSPAPSPWLPRLLTVTLL